MEINKGSEKTKYVQITLTGDEVAMAIDEWLASQGVHVTGPRTINVNGNLIETVGVYVDPSGSVVVWSKPTQEYINNQKSPPYSRFYREGKVAVLYSPGYGAGWQSWNIDHKGIIFDSEIVEAVLAGDKAAAIEVAERKYKGCYTGGADDLTVTWLEEGTIFEIEEYDGKESIHIIGGREYMVA